jgi:hypothetical protein
VNPVEEKIAEDKEEPGAVAGVDEEKDQRGGSGEEFANDGR